MFAGRDRSTLLMTRRLPEAVERHPAETFDATLWADDRPRLGGPWHQSCLRKAMSNGPVTIRPVIGMVPGSICTIRSVDRMKKRSAPAA